MRAEVNRKRPNTLFDNPPGRERDERPAPAAVVKELIDVWGMAPRVAGKLPLRAAFARLYAFRKKAMALTGDALRATAAELAAKLRTRAADREAPAADLTNAGIEALAVLDDARLRRVLAGLANLLNEVAA